MYGLCFHLFNDLICGTKIVNFYGPCWPIFLLLRVFLASYLRNRHLRQGRKGRLLCVFLEIEGF